MLYMCAAQDAWYEIHHAPISASLSSPLFQRGVGGDFMLWCDPLGHGGSHVKRLTDKFLPCYRLFALMTRAMGDSRASRVPRRGSWRLTGQFSQTVGSKMGRWRMYALYECHSDLTTRGIKWFLDAGPGPPEANAAQAAEKEWNSR